MKKSLTDIFDEANAKELDVLCISETDMSLPEGASLDKIKKRVYKKTGLAAPKKRPVRLRWQSVVALAACVCLVVGGAVGGVWFYIQNNASPDIVEEIPYRTVDEFLRDFEGVKIIWGLQNNSEDHNQALPDSDTDGDRDVYPEIPNTEFLVWNGLNVSKELYEALDSASDTDVFALKLIAMSEPEVKLSEFFYNGKSWAELSQERNEINGIVNALNLLKEHSIIADHGYHSKEVIEEKMKQVAYEFKEDVGEDFLPKYYKDGVFDNEKISDDLRDGENRKAQIQGEMIKFVSAYNKKYKPEFNTDIWAKKYYVVAGDYGKYLVIDREQLSSVSKDTSLPSLENAAFILASQAELLRSDEVADIQPYEPDEPHLNVPTDEQPLPDVDVGNYENETDYPSDTMKE